MTEQTVALGMLGLVAVASAVFLIVSMIGLERRRRKFELDALALRDALRDAIRDHSEGRP